MTQYTEVAVNAAVDQTFTYHIPPALTVTVGQLVRVAFGTAQQPGIVVGLSADSPIDTTKPILDVFDPEPVVTPEQINLARWIAETTVCPLGIALWVWLPPGIAGRRGLRVSLQDASVSVDDAVEARLIDVLRKRGPLTDAQIERAMKSHNWERIARRLARRGSVTIESILHRPRARPKKIQVAALAVAPEHLPYVRDRLGKPNRQSDALDEIIDLQADRDSPLTVEDVLAIKGVGKATLKQLIEAGAISRGENETLHLTEPAREQVFALKDGERDERILRVLAREDKPLDVSWIYAQASADVNDLKRLEANGLVTLGEKEVIRDPLAGQEFVPVSAPRLTPAQQTAWSQIKRVLDGNGGRILLHGVTGSGKTELYLRAMEWVVKRGQTVIFLVPEIALTPQTIRRVKARFPERVAVVHSDLNTGERYDTWRRARAGEIDVVVGTRSALFTPLPAIGLIILDEEHDTSYQQTPPLAPPYYHARDVAEAMARQSGATVILGSATPDAGTRWRAERGDLRYLRLPDRIMGHRVRLAEQSTRAGIIPRYEVQPSDSSDALSIDLPPVQVVDMRDELKQGNISMFSRALQIALSDVLGQGQQAILFLNRRGQSTYVFCRDCGYVAVCPRCDTPLTYHTADTHLHCHHCGYRTIPPEVCPACESRRIRYFGAGTQEVEAAFKAAFPGVVALRWDADRTGPHDLVLDRFLNQQAQVLIGTQMIAKGLDLPLVTLVGVVSADVGLNLPDFRATERTFQLLTQVAGRAGRGLLGGRVILQTYQPDNPAIRHAAEHDTDGFYASEITARREMGYPPFRRLARVLLTDTIEARVRDMAERAAETLQSRLDLLGMWQTTLIGPAPCFFSRLNRQYRWQVLLRGPDPAQVFAEFDLPRDWTVMIDPMDVL